MKLISRFASRDNIVLPRGKKLDTFFSWDANGEIRYVLAPKAPEFFGFKIICQNLLKTTDFLDPLRDPPKTSPKRSKTP